MHASSQYRKPSESNGKRKRTAWLHEGSSKVRNVRQASLSLRYIYIYMYIYIYIKYYRECLELSRTFLLKKLSSDSSQCLLFRCEWCFSLLGFSSLLAWLIMFRSNAVGGKTPWQLREYSTQGRGRRVYGIRSIYVCKLYIYIYI